MYKRNCSKPSFSQTRQGLNLSSGVLKRYLLVPSLFHFTPISKGNSRRKVFFVLNMLKDPYESVWNLFISRQGTRTTDGGLYLLQCLQSLWINFPDEVSLASSIKIIPSFHNVDQTVVCELRNGVRQIGECPVQREISLELWKPELPFPHVEHRWPCSATDLGLPLPAVPTPGSSLEKVGKQRRWTSPMPLPWVRAKDMQVTVFPHTNGHPGPFLLSALVHALVYQDGLMTLLCLSWQNLAYQFLPKSC